MKSARPNSLAVPQRVPDPQPKAQHLEVIMIRPGGGGVADYADDISAALQELGALVHEIRAAAPGNDTVISTVRLVRHLRALRSNRSDDRRRLVVHAELSAASVAPLWAIGTLRGVLRTATIHDPPHAAWWPLRVKAVNGLPVLNHAIHFPLRRIFWQLEDLLLLDVDLFCLSQTAARAFGPSERITVIPHYIRPIHIAEGTWQRPLGVGLFGYPYGGKGFNKIAQLRALLPPDVRLEIAGRGTERLDFIPGVHVWGEVDARREIEFFGSIRCLLLPYDSGGRYGDMLSSSGAAARAMTFRTPVVASATRAFVEESASGALWAEPDLAQITQRALWLIHSRQRLETVDAAIRRLAMNRDPRAIASQMVDRWAR